MIQRILSFVKYYVFWVVFFVIQKPLFMLLNVERFTFGDCCAVMAHGLPLDLSVAAYLTIFYGVLLIVDIWVRSDVVKIIRDVYTGIMIALTLLIFIGDVGCFPAWGYHLNKDVFDYLATPKEVLACAPWWQWMVGFGCWLLAIGLWWFIYRVLTKGERPATNDRRVAQNVVMFLMTSCLFLPMRGSVTVSTMNTGRVYFSEDRALNLAAVNPVFNLVESLSENTLNGERYHYMPAEEASRIWEKEIRSGVLKEAEKLFTTTRPNIVLVVLESFSRNVLFAMPNMERYAKEGIYFSNMYANSYRTDRGLMAVLSAFPGSATTSLMMVPDKAAKIPQIGQVLAKEGYRLKFYYGGDEDFTNMRSYLMNGGFKERVSDHDFPLSDRLSKWGAQDHVLFDFAAKDINDRLTTNDQRLFSVVLSLSSHEPFEVPYHHYEDSYINAVAYTDSCLGAFVEKLRESPKWESTVVVLVPDHGYPYPRGIHNYEPRRFAIPLVMVGGAIKEPKEINTLCSQIDWVPTVLHQMNIDAEQFVFAKDILNAEQTPYAYYNFVDGFALITYNDTTIIDAKTNEAIAPYETDTLRAKQARAITQKIYEYID